MRSTNNATTHTTNASKNSHKHPKLSNTNNQEFDTLKSLNQLQEHLDDLQSDRASMEIVYNSLKNAFLIYPSAELDEIDKEICRAYDDLMAQVRQLDRSLKRIEKKRSQIYSLDRSIKRKDPFCSQNDPFSS